MPFETEQITLDSGIVVLTLSGSMTLGNLLQRFEWKVEEMTKQNQNRIVVDMSGISFLDSTGVGVLAKCSALAKNSGGQLRLAALTDRSLETFKLVGLDTVLLISTTTAEAVKAIAAAA